ncbi:MAG: ATP-dependent Clp protease ATP-binding subunit [Clostridia bacterium]|nr:ATP-dependent Clp protease ATP-binding subunit [Clostridia bacterium]
MMIYKFTARAKKAIDLAGEIAKELGHSYIGTEHILYGLAKEGSGVASKVLENQSINAQKIENEIIELIGKEEALKETLGFTPRTKRVLENSFVEVKKIGYDYIGTEHLLIGILREGDSIAVRILLDLNVDIPKIYNEIVSVVSEVEAATGSKNDTKKNVSKSNNPILNQFGEDLTKKALDGKLDPVIGRNDEIQRVIQILSRRTKNNPCLIGESGVGKTAIVEGLAEKIAIGDVPELLREKQVFSMDISGMVAGAKYRGDFEERIKKALAEVKKAGNIILFIDEIHTIVGAGSAEGAIDAANILKPMLARGDIQLIGTTTIEEYRKYIEKDSALERRFSPIIVAEPNKEDTIQILNGLRDKYEAHHNVKITDEAINAAVELSSRFINDRFLPDKAIDLIDEAASKERLKAYTEPDLLKKLEEELDKIIKDKDEAIRSQKFEKAAELRDKEIEITEQKEKEEQKWKNKNTKTMITIYEENIAEIISNSIGIPVDKINKNENEKLKNLANKLHERVIGQNEAIEAVAKAIRRGRVGLKDPNRPIGSFLFLGPTGVGKTELSKAVAECLFGGEKDLIRIDMSEYMEPHSVSKLIGSPPGYVGFEEGGQLTEKIRRKPYSVILLDEVEKAHPDVMNILLQILDDGRLTDSNGRTVDFKNTVIIMTSNIGARLITDKKNLGFGNSSNADEQKEYENTKKDVMAELKREFRPEFINRIDEVIVFHKLNDDEIKQIIDLMLKQVENRLKEQKINIKIDESVKELIAKQGINKAFGARPLRRTIQSLVEDSLAEAILDSKEGIGKKEFVIDVDGEKVVVK